MFELIRNILIKIPSSVFMCLTPNLDLANRIINKKNIPTERTILKHIHYREINKYLNAGDIGLMIREDLITNSVASPTKVPEYCMSGMPILISNRVGDYSDFILSNNLGIVVHNNIEQIISLLIEKKSFKSKKEISAIMSNLYSKQSYINKIIEVYEEI